MNALALTKLENLTAAAGNPEDIIHPKDFTFYVYLVDGTVQEVAPATGLRLTNAEVIFVLGEIVITRLPRREVYFAARQPTAPPVLF